MYVPSTCLSRRARTTIVAVLALGVAFQSVAATDSASSPFPGLELVISKNVGALYRRPDVDTSEYGKIMIGEPAVQFSKNWNPRNYGTYGLSATQLNKIRVDLAALAARGCPVAFIAGAHDGVVPEAMRPMAEACPGASFTIVAEAGHLPNIDQPAAFNAALAALLAVR